MSGLGILSWLGGGLFSLLKSPMTLVMSAAAIAGGILYIQLQIAHHQVDALKIEVANQKAEIWTMEANYTIHVKNEAALADLIKVQQDASTNLVTVTTAIDQTPQSEDGPVADVLRKELAR